MSRQAAVRDIRPLFAEALAIIISILLAFAIDAWWDGRVEHGRSLAQLRTIETEFVEVELELQDLEARLLGLRRAVSELLSHIAPDSQLQTMDSLYALIDLGFRAGKIEKTSLDIFTTKYLQSGLPTRRDR